MSQSSTIELFSFAAEFCPKLHHLAIPALVPIHSQEYSNYFSCSVTYRQCLQHIFLMGSLFCLVSFRTLTVKQLALSVKNLRNLSPCYMKDPKKPCHLHPRRCRTGLQDFLTYGNSYNKI